MLFDPEAVLAEAMLKRNGLEGLEAQERQLSWDTSYSKVALTQLMLTLPNDLTMAIVSNPVTHASFEMLRTALWAAERAMIANNVEDPVVRAVLDAMVKTKG